MITHIRTSWPLVLRYSWFGGVLVFALLSIWARQHALFPGEQELARSLQRHQFRALLGYEEVADIIGARVTLYVMAALGVLVFVTIRQWALALLAALAPLLTILGGIMKSVVERPRPTAEQVVALREIRTGYSFPSGHSLQATIITMVIVIAAQQLLHGWQRRVVQAIAIWCALTIGWERVFDGVHWPTDVAGGFLLGVLATFGLWHVMSLVRSRYVARRGDATREAQRRTELSAPTGHSDGSAGR